MALDVRGLPLKAAGRLMDHDAGVGQGVAHVLLASASNSDPIDAAWPMHIVETFGRMNCIVS